ncbi:conserved hypothetical protein [Ricinus communis]|uniref:Nuclease associated modular domain-containing protein n=2 Tax=Ricinus communis TaxID=3988 RepID=B9T4Y5_RICCO|nr:conserved hypothetical protein [Ricinus communis]
MKSLCCSYASISSIPKLQHSGAFQISSDSGKHFQLKCGQDSADTENLNEEVLPDGNHDSYKSLVNDKKRQRKRNRKHGNKGKVPWNKGRKHTAETRKLIRQRTLEALRDPQVRKKMAEHPCAHSEEIKKKIGSALRQLWDKRLKWKKLREKFFLSWTRSIAEAARKGGIDQQELDWESYNEIREEITLQQLQCAIDKAKAKELAKITAERVAQAKAEKMERLAQKRKEREEKAKTREEAKRKSRKNSKKNADNQSAVKELSLRKRLTKIRKKKSINTHLITQGEAVISHSPAWKRLNVELMKKEKVQREVSLADQIRAAKSKRTEPMAREALAETSSHHFLQGDH